MKKILISACLFGENVRYDGGNNSIMSHPILEQLHKDDRLIPICPEELGGLPTPRVPVEIREGRAISQDGIDVTKQFELGATLIAQKAIDENIGIALLKSRSPSCGKGKIYDGSFSKKLIKGNGFSAHKLEIQGVKVFSEENLDQLEFFLEKSDK